MVAIPVIIFAMGEEQGKSSGHKPLRRAVVTAVGINKVLGVMQLTDDAELTFTPKTPVSEDAVKKLRVAAASYEPASKSDMPPDKHERWRGLLDHLRSQGYVVDEAPSGDLQFTFSIDLESGRMVGEQRPLHAAAEVLPALEKRIFASLGNAFAHRFEQLVSEVDLLVEGQCFAEAVDVVLCCWGSGEFALVKTDRMTPVLARIPVDAVLAEKFDFFKVRAALAGLAGEHDLASRDAERLLEAGHYDDESERIDLETVVALGTRARGLFRVSRGSRQLAWGRGRGRHSGRGWRDACS